MNGCVSVIVPIYKVEAYLKRAIESILNQTYSNLEIILVDDGSPDNCGKICDDYAGKDNRIKVVHKENGGLSDARNAGLDIATGEYIAFVDSDDYIAPDYVEILLTQLLKQEADVAMCSYAVTKSTEYDDTIFALVRDASDEDVHIRDGEVEVCSRSALLANLYDANHRDATYFIVAWNKLYKAKLWKDIRFPKGKIHEDEATTYRIYDRAEKGVYIHKPMYGYFCAPESITRSRFSLKRLQWMDALDDRIAYFEEKGDKAQVAYAERARADGAIHYYYPLRDELPEEKASAKRLKNYVKEECMQKGLPFTKRLGYLLFLFSAPLYRMVTCVGRDKKERIYQIACCLLFAWLILLCFYKLDVKYVDPWDESRHGVNAYEMLKEGNLIQNTYLYKTDYYNLKPPMSMWTIMLSMAAFGASVFTMRLPSVLCYLILALVVVCFARKRYGRSSAVFALAFLAANTTPFLAHMVRAGDADSLYVLLFTLAMLCMLRIGEKQSNLYWCAILFALAFLTKSFHAGVIVAIGGLYLLFTGELKKMKPVIWVKFIASAVIPIALWGGLRLMTDGTGFLKEMWLTDVCGRSGKGFGSNEAGFSYYFSYYLGNMSGSVQIYLVVCILLFVCGIIAVWDVKKKTQCSFLTACKRVLLHRDTIGFALWIIVPTLAFSVVATKLLWYLYPAVTALLIGAGIAIGKVLQDCKLSRMWKETIGYSALAIAGVYSLMLFGTFRNYGLNGAQTNAFQLLIQQTAEDESLDGVDVYVALEGDSLEAPVNHTWAQQDVFVAEAYGDYRCRQGGLAALLVDMEEEDYTKEKIIFTTVGYFESKILPELDSTGMMPDVLASSEQYVAILVEW